MPALLGITRSPDDPRWVLIVFALGLATLWYNHWTGVWWLYRSRSRVIGLTVLWIGLFALLAVL